MMEARIISYTELVFGVRRKGRVYLKDAAHWCEQDPCPHGYDKVSPPQSTVEIVDGAGSTSAERQDNADSSHD